MKNFIINLLNEFTAQANKWLRNVEKANGLRVIQYTDGNYMEILAESILNGNSVLLENIRKIIFILLYLSFKNKFHSSEIFFDLISEFIDFLLNKVIVFSFFSMK